MFFPSERHRARTAGETVAQLTRLARLIALVGVAGPAAREVQPPPSMQRVEITGSSIKRITREGALPIQVITFDDMQKQGITSAEQLIRTISANGTGADNAT